MPLISLHHWISELDRRQDTVNQSTDDLRTTRDIIWSCLATIFACTWIAMHPNLPDPQDTKVARFKRRVIVMLVALVAPEYILLWALKQRMAAGIIAKEYNRIIHSRPRADQTCSTLSPCYRHPAGVQGPQKWTIVHGFFLQMGGILIADGNTGCPEKALTLPLLKELIELGEVNPIELSEEEIEDKSKGDILTKLLVVLQTSWFVLQCLARWATQLSVTELEVMTFSFAILNVITYALWWYKPQNVCVPVIIHRKPKQTQDIEYGVWESRSPGFSTFENFPPPLPPPRCHHQDSSENEMDITDSVALSQASQYEVPEICATSDQSIYPQGISEFRSSAAQYPTRSQPRWAWCFDKLASVLRQSITYPKTALDRIGRLLKSIWEAKLYRKVIVAVGPQSDNSHLTSSLKFATVDSERHATFPDGAECGLNSPMLPDISAELRTYAVGTFHASEIDGSPGYYYYCLVVLGVMSGVLFGGLHLIPWAHDNFPTSTEWLLWRISALYIMIHPVLLSLPLFLVIFVRTSSDWNISFSMILLRGKIFGFLYKILPVLMPFMRVVTALLPLYILARCCLIILAFSTLRELGPNLFKEIPWNSYIPHI